jgi:hypothetical protein
LTAGFEPGEVHWCGNAGIADRWNGFADEAYLMLLAAAASITFEGLASRQRAIGM